jgi:DNA-binding NarL/FixJ family response regulator
MQTVVTSLKRIHVLLAEMPPMLKDIVRQTVGNEPDMVVVGELTSGAHARQAAQDVAADVVIVATPNADDATAPHELLDARPHMLVLALAVDGRTAVMYEFRPHRVSLGEVSPRALVDAIRTGAASHARWSP